jgi:hypothetical protein
METTKKYDLSSLKSVKSAADFAIKQLAKENYDRKLTVLVNNGVEQPVPTQVTTISARST